MTDDHGDAEFEASLASLDDGIDDATTDPGPGVGSASLANRLDSVQSTMSTLGMRIDSLVTSTTSYRSALTDRLAEYAEVVNKANRSQSAELEEYRRATERTVAEVRRAITTMDEGLTRLAARIDDIGLDATGETDPESRRVVAEVRSILDSQERLSEFLTKSLDKFGEAVLDRLARSNDELASGITGVRTVVDELAAGEKLGSIASELGAVRAAVEAIATTDPSAAVAEELGAVRGEIAALSSRDLTAGFREDVAQLRAMVTAVGEQDARPDVSAVQADLTVVRSLVEGLAAADPSAPVNAALAPLADAVERISGHLDAADARERSGHEQLLDRLGVLAERLDGLAAATTEPLLDRLGTLTERLDGLAAATTEPLQARFDAIDATLSAAAGAADAHRDTAVAERATLLQVARSTESRIGTIADDVRHEIETGVAALRDTSRVDEALAQIQELLLDVASGEVLGALWDEFRSLRDAVDAAASARQSTAKGDRVALVADVAAQVDRLAASIPPPSTEPDPAIPALEAAVAELTAEVRTLLAAAEVPEDGSFADEVVLPEELLAPLTSGLDELRTDLTTLRGELADGLSVEPAPALLDALAVLHDDMAGLPAAVAALPDVQSGLDELRVLVADVADRIGAASAPSDEPAGRHEWMAGDAEGDGDGDGDGESDTGGMAAVASELQALRDAIDLVHSRLDEGLVLTDDGAPAPAGDANVAVVVADEIAGVRDLLAVEFDALRAEIDSLGAAASSAATAAPTGEAAVVGAPDGFVTIDPDTIDLLREEIRNAGGVADEVVDALREEIKALRRRIAVKAQEKVLSDDQLAQIADAVADRLAK